MASSSDVRDMLGLSAAAAGASKPGGGPPKKKQKTGHGTPIGGGLHKPLRGMNREVHALIGERAAPVAIMDPGKAYRRKLGPKRKAKPWVRLGFRNAARGDGLVLRHWVRKPAGATTAGRVEAKREGDEADGDAVMGEDGAEAAAEKDEENAVATASAAGGAAGEGEETDPQVDEAEYRFAKYDVRIPAPEWDGEQYEAHLRDEGWSREETEYLVQMVRDYAQRWPVIADRWDFVAPDAAAPPQLEQKPQEKEAGETAAAGDDEDGSEVKKEGEPSQEERPDASVGDQQAAQSNNETRALVKPRSIEELKHRYYAVSAKVMALKSPGGVRDMNDAEFALHETLSKFDPAQEATRKKLAASMLNRGIDELKEEEYLIAELQRIMTSQQRLEAERAELRARLEVAPALRMSNEEYSSSAALNELFQRLINSSRSAKRAGGAPGGRLSLSAGDMLPSPAYPNGTPMSGHPGRDSFGAGQKRGSLGGPAGTPASATAASGAPLRTLSAKQERRFGVSTHEKLQAGVQFPTDRIAKARQAKSVVQTQRLNAALAELRVPEVLPLPSAEVVEAFEDLTARITRLMDARRVLEREQGDVKVARNVKADRARRESGAGVDGAADENEAKAGAAVDGAADDAGDDITAANAADDAEEDDAEGEADGEGDAEGEDDENNNDDEEDGEGDDDADRDAEADADGDAEADVEGEEAEDYEDAEGEDDAEGEEEAEAEAEDGEDMELDAGAGSVGDVEEEEGEDGDDALEDAEEDEAEAEEEDAAGAGEAEDEDPAELNADAEEDDEEADAEAEAEPATERPSTGGGSVRPGSNRSHTPMSTRASGRKRSASVLSGGSIGSGKRARR